MSAPSRPSPALLVVLLGAAVALGGLSACSGGGLKPGGLGRAGIPRAAEKSRLLFDGESLAGWHADVPSADGNANVDLPFVARDGMLVSLGKPGGHLITDESFRDYRLVLEWRWPDLPGNNGILVHVSEPRWFVNMFPKSMEVQLHHGNAGDLICIGEDITVPDMEKRRGPKETWGVGEGKARRIANLTDDSEKKPGEWNEMVIECRGNAITVRVNGHLVNHGTDCTTSHGRIAIQAEGAVCEFRKLLLTALD